jgi:hypothetical protein
MLRVTGWASVAVALPAGTTLLVRLVDPVSSQNPPGTLLECCSASQLGSGGLALPVPFRAEIAMSSNYVIKTVDTMDYQHRAINAASA